MFCRYCQTLLFDTQGPCPSCGASLPLAAPQNAAANTAWSAPANAWGDAATNQWGAAEPGAGWNAPASQQGTPNHGWSNSPAQPWEQSPQAFGGAIQPFTPPAPQVMSPVNVNPPTDQRQALVPYQGGMQQQYPLQTIPLQLLPDHALEKLLPALPQQEESIYVAPMYTKPRAIIPRYRILSGFLSVLIVVIALCSGAGYYAQASGKIAAISRFLVGAPPPSLQPTPQTKIPDPPDKVDKGPSYDTIPSATTTSRINADNVALQPDKIFKPGQVFYLTYSVVAPKHDGHVIIKWYMNDILFQQDSSLDNNNPPIPAGKDKNGYTNMVYPQATSGKVELYWTDEGGQPQLAETLYFAVRNS